MDKQPSLRIVSLLLFAVFVIATCGLVYELVAGALASYLLGDSVKQFSFVIGTYLFSMGVGSYVSKFIKGDFLIAFIKIEILIGLVGGLSAAVLFSVFDAQTPFQVILYSFVFGTGFLVGLEIPLLMNLLQDRLDFKDLVSNVFAFDYVGALLASILFPLVLVPQLGLVRTSVFFGLINVAVAILLCYWLKEELKKARYLKWVAMAVWVLLLVVFIFSNAILAYSEGKLYNENIIYARTTPYQRLVLTRTKNDFRLYLNNNLQFSSLDEYRYHESLVHPAMSLAPQAKHVLVLGGGDGLAVREILKYDSLVSDITLVDLDKDMTKLFQTNTFLVEQNKGSLNNPKVKVINTDAYVWLRENKQLFDVVIVDFPDPSNYSVGKLYTVNFYETLKQSLTPEAVVTVQTTSPFFAPKSFWCIQRTIQEVFPRTQAYHTYVPSFGEWGFVLATQQAAATFKTPQRQVPGLRFYDYNLENLSYFSADMRNTNVEINRLDNQILVRYFDDEWSKY